MFKTISMRDGDGEKCALPFGCIEIDLCLFRIL